MRVRLLSMCLIVCEIRLLLLVSGVDDSDFTDGSAVLLVTVEEHCVPGGVLFSFFLMF